MSPDALAYVIAPTIAGVCAIVAALVGDKARRESKAAKHASRQACENTSKDDHFAEEVRAGLGEILTVATEARDEARVAHELIDEHLQAHANAHVYELPAARVARGNR